MGAVRARFEERLQEVLPGSSCEFVDEVAAVAHALDAGDADVLLSGGSTQTLSLIEHVRGRPVVMWGEAQALAGRPLSGVCGFCLPDDVDEARLRLLKAAIPGLRTVGLLYDDGYPPGALALQRSEAAAPGLGLELVVYHARSRPELERAFAAMPADGVQAVRVLNSRFAGRTDSGVVELALRGRLPLMSYDWTTRDGGLLSYTPDFVKLAAPFADLVAAVAGGAAPSALGIRPAAMKLEVNLQTARALGLGLPAQLLDQATTVYG